MTRAGWAARMGLAVLITVSAMTGSEAASAVEPDPDAFDTLAPGQSMSSGSSLVSANEAFFLDMQTDGNLVEYRSDGLPLWDSGTGGHPGATATMQQDGNLVVLSAEGAPLWNSGTLGHPGAFLTLQSDANAVVYDPAGPALWASLQQSRAYPWQYTLYSGETLVAGDFLYSGRWRAVMQQDGNFVVYDGAQAAWSSGTSGHSDAYATMQPDGNLVIYWPRLIGNTPYTDAIWHVRSANNGSSQLRLQADGNLVVYRADGSPTWWRTRDTSTNVSFGREDPQYGVSRGADCRGLGATGFTGNTRESERLTCRAVGMGFDVPTRWQ